MDNAILLILRIPDSDNERVAIKKVGDRVDVKPVEWDMDREGRVSDQAIQYAKENAKDLVVLQILTSDLYHWGFNDTILPGPAKSRFIGHIREEIMKNSMKSTTMLEEKANRAGVNLEIHKVETRDPEAVALGEAGKGYERIFIVKEKKRFFPIFKKTLEDHLKKELSIPIITFQ